MYVCFICVLRFIARKGLIQNQYSGFISAKLTHKVM